MPCPRSLSDKAQSWTWIETLSTDYSLVLRLMSVSRGGCREEGANGYSEPVRVQSWGYRLTVVKGDGERNNNPLQCACLENLRDGGAWWAAVCGVAQSRTRLKRLSSSSSRSKRWAELLPGGSWYRHWQNVPTHQMFSITRELHLQDEKKI